MTRRVELKIPAAVEASRDAVELVRVWAADGRQHISLATGVWPDPAAWGIALADLARHIARAYEHADGIPAGEALERMREALLVEWQSPTDVPRGGLID